MINIGYIEQKSIFYHTILAEEAHYYLQNNIKRLSVLVNTELAFCFEKGHCADSSYLNPIRPGLFSRSPGPGGGSEAQMPKIEVNINQLK